MRKLCVRSLRRGVGSMDFIQGLLIMEDDLDEGHEEDESDVTPTPSTSTDLACSSNPGTPDPAPSPSNNAIPWCKCGVCQIMPQEIENKCCGLRRCVTTHTRFSKLCLDPDVIQLAIRNRGDIRNDRDDNSTLERLATLVRETGKCVLPVLSLLSGGTIHPKLVFTWDTGLSNCKITLPPQVLANSNVNIFIKYPFSSPKRSMGLFHGEGGCKKE